jgi:hypothetical protein
MKDTIFGFILGLIGSGFGAFLAHRLSEKRDRKNIFEKAAERFRAAFTEQLMKLDESNSFEVTTTHNFIYDLHKSNYETVNRAQAEFRQYLNDKELLKFDEAWKDYCCKKNKYSDEFKEYDLVPHDTDAFPQPRLRDAYRRLALKRIEWLLSFAKPMKPCWHITSCFTRIAATLALRHNR